MTGRMISFVIVLLSLCSMARAEGKIIGVSWANFQEERWKTDEASMKATIEAAGDTYISADAQSSSSKQIADIDSLISQGADALIILPQDPSAIVPAVEAATREGIPVVAYGRPIEHQGALYVDFDNTETGRIQAREVLKVRPAGNYAFIKGAPADPNADLQFLGQMEVLNEAIRSGRINVVGEAYTDGWLPDNAQKNMEQILTATNNNVDAILASNDGTAGGVIAALEAQGLAGTVAVSGQDGDTAALNRIALGTQTLSVWKDASELGKIAADIASELAAGTPAETISSAGVLKTPSGFEIMAVLLSPVVITKDNLDVAVDAGWISKDIVCQGVAFGTLGLCDDDSESSVLRPSLDICFGTDRKHIMDGDTVKFTHERDDNTVLGFVKVSVPKDREFKDPGRPGVWKSILIRIGVAEEDPRRYFIIQSRKIFGEGSFRDISELALSRSAKFKNHVLVYVHGFNVDFDDAAYVTAQLADDMGFDGLPCMYSWPSMGTLSAPAYVYDGNSAKQSRVRLAEFLELVRTLKGADTISIVTHSMGSLALTEALRELNHPGEQKPYAQIILAAPDMDENDFRTVASKLTDFSSGVTLYASAHDRALDEAKRMAGNVHRAGDVKDGSPIVVSEIDSIDASSVSDYVFGINHSYYANNRAVVSDIATLILKGERPPETRNPTFRRFNSSTGTFWSFP